ncbi:Protein diaphanous-like protein, partial [Zancudomyces culisetae]
PPSTGGPPPPPPPPPPPSSGGSSPLASQFRQVLGKLDSPNSADGASSFGYNTNSQIASLLQGIGFSGVGGDKSGPGLSNSTVFAPLPRKELRFIPRKKLKAVQWEKVSDQATLVQSFWIQNYSAETNVDQTIEDKLSTTGIFDKVETMFAAKEAVDLNALREKKRREKALAQQQQAGGEGVDDKGAAEAVSILDPKRANNINIMLGRLRKYTFEEIKTALLQLDDSIIGENTIKQFLIYLPTSEERSLLTNQAKNNVLMARADQFLYEMMQVYRYDSRLSVMLTRLTWREKYSELKDDISSVSKASNAVTKSPHIPVLMGVILTIGNYMNGAGFRGGAFGFKISSLSRLLDTKATDNKTTLLHFVALVVEEAFPDALQFLEDLKPLDAACRVSYPELKTELSELQNNLDNAKSELDTYILDNQVEGDAFIPKISEFVQRATIQLNILDSAMTEMDESYTIVARLFGEDPQGMPADEFFAIFKSFCVSFERAIKENAFEKNRKLVAEKRRKQIEAALEARKRERELRNEKSNKSLNSNASINSREASAAKQSKSHEKGAIDDLLNSLRTGAANRIAASASTSPATGVSNTSSSSITSLFLNQNQNQPTNSNIPIERLRPKRREISSIRHSTYRKSLHRTSISKRALQMLQEMNITSPGAGTGGENIVHSELLEDQMKDSNNASTKSAKNTTITTTLGNNSGKRNAMSGGDGDGTTGTNVGTVPDITTKTDDDSTVPQSK